MPAQRVDIALRCTELLDEIKRKAKENQAEFKGNRFTGKVESDSMDTNSKETGRVSKQIADIANKKTPTEWQVLGLSILCCTIRLKVFPLVLHRIVALHRF